MFKRLLVAYDGSRGAEAALLMGIDLAKATGAELATVSVEEHLPRYAATIGEVEEARAAIDAHFHALTKHARDLALVEGLEIDALVRQGHEVDTILAVVREGKFDLLVIGDQGHRRILKRLVGSTAHSLARLAPCSILLMRNGEGPARGLGRIRRILVGLDGSPLGRLAFHATLDLAILSGGTVIGVTVREVPAGTRPEVIDWTDVRQLQAAAEAQARSAGVAFTGATRVGHAAQALSDQAKESAADLLVLGATGLEHPWSPTLGGTAGRVAGEAPCPVLLVRAPQEVLHVRDVMVRAVSVVTSDTSLSEVVELLLRRNVKAIPVLDERRRVVGIVTGGDLLRRGGLDLRLSLKQELDAEALRERLAELGRSRKTARDVMTRSVRTVGADLDLDGAIRLMAERRVKRLPVVDQRGELVGIVSRADVLRAVAALPEPAEPSEREPVSGARTVGDVVTPGVPTVSPEARAEEVLGKLLEHPLRRVVVTGPDGRVRGLISDRDLLLRSSPDTRPWLLRALTGGLAGLRREARGERGGAGLTAGELMAPSLITVRPEDPLRRAIQLMMQHRVKRLVVVDRAGHLIGLVDRRETLRSLAGNPARRGGPGGGR
jgi:CBS-domain-containing membrane protein/nucleotide-binding universal stress UspA family protein